MGRISLNDAMYAELAEIAHTRGVTVDEQAQIWLRESIQRHAFDRKLRDSFARVADMTPTSTPQTDSVEILREARRH